MTKDLTHDTPLRVILRFSLPLLIGNIFQQLYNTADTLVVGRMINVDALAAVGATGSLTFLIFGFATGFTSGIAIITARRFGAGDTEGTRKSVATGILLSGVLSLVLTVLAASLTRPMLQLMRTPEHILDAAYLYLLIVFLATGAVIYYNQLSNIMRALGDSRTPVIILIIACIVNIALDIIFVGPLGMGVEGAALATAIAQVLAALVCLFYIRRFLPQFWPQKQDFHFSLEHFRPYLKLALPMGFQSSIVAIGAIILQFVLNGLGSDYIAANTAGQRIDSFAMMPMMSFGTAMATFASQNYGAGKLARVRQGVRVCTGIMLAFSVTVGALFIVFGKQLAFLFVGHSEQVVAGYVGTFLSITGCFYWSLSVLFILRNTLQGLGQTRAPTLSGVLELVMRTFVAIVFTALWGFTGLCFASPAAWLVGCLPLVISYFKTMKYMAHNNTPDGPENAIVPDHTE